MNVTLRLPEPADYEVITSWVPDAQSCLWWAGPRVRFPFTAAELPSLLILPGKQGQSFCLAEGSANPLGFGQYWIIKRGAVHLARIIISPAVRGQGFGRLLCQLLITRAIQATGALEVTLAVFRDNVAALSLYSSLGFSAVKAEGSENVLIMRAEANPRAERTGGSPSAQTQIGRQRRLPLVTHPDCSAITSYARAEDQM
jgi:ribosomal protein S18 acetylase RimI-like enzyme